MKVIERGNPKTFFFECEECNSKLEYYKKDILRLPIGSKGDIEHRTTVYGSCIICPVCEEKLILKEEVDNK
jgi:uncharacterized protein with PIN domain